MNINFLDQLGGHVAPISVTKPVDEQASLTPTNIMVSPPRPPKPANGGKK